MGWLVLVGVGAVLWWWSIAQALRSYPGERMPLWKNPQKVPGRAVLLRAVGAGCASLGMAMSASALASEPWVAGVITGTALAALLLVPYVAAVAVHNHGLPARE